MSASAGQYVLGGGSYNHAGCYKGALVSVEGHPVRFDARANPGYVFDHWSNGSTETFLYFPPGQPVSSVRAYFHKKTEHILTVESGPDMPCSGYVTVEPAKKYYGHYEQVTLTAHPAPGYKVVSVL